jgi:glycosyltransferase involved in cell wall biosynthesis
MKILIVSTTQRLSGYYSFVDALISEGAEATCVHDIDYCYLCETKPFYVIPVPKLLKVIKEYRPDFVLTDSPYYVLQMTKILGRNALFHMRGGEEGSLTERAYDIALYPDIFARVYTNYLSKIIVPSMKKADFILPNSKWLQTQFKQVLPNHPNFVLYVGITPEDWSQKGNGGLRLKQPSVVGVFQFSIYAKVVGFLKFMKVAERMPHVNFYFAGDGPYLNSAKLHSPANVIFLGKLPTTEVKKLLETGDLFVHPSGLDALPRSIKEASLMEKAVVASNIGGIPEIVQNGQTGFLCDLDDYDEWVERINFLLEHPDVARRFGKDGRKFVVEKFSWRTIAHDFLRNMNTFLDK